MKTILRIIASPFFFMINWIFFTYQSLRNTYYMIKYGGECITYMNDDKPTIAKIYYKMKDNENSNIRP